MMLDAVNAGEEACGDSESDPQYVDTVEELKHDGEKSRPNPEIEFSEVQDVDEEIMVVSAKGPAFGSKERTRRRQSTTASASSSALTAPPPGHIAGTVPIAVKTETFTSPAIEAAEEPELQIVSQHGPRLQHGNSTRKILPYHLVHNQAGSSLSQLVPKQEILRIAPPLHPKQEPGTAHHHAFPVFMADPLSIGVPHHGQSSVKSEPSGPLFVAPTPVPSHAHSGSAIFGAGAHQTAQQSAPMDVEDNVNETSVEACQEFERLNALHADATEEAETPTELNVKLHPHQKRALCWMVKREQKNSNSANSAMDSKCFGGILADDQGLGKTLSTIALLYKNPPADNAPWKTIIVCPVSLVNQWKRELKTRVKRGEVKRVHVYHGNEKTRSLTQLRHFDVVITTYGTVGGEYPKILKDHPNYEMCVKEGLEKPTRSKGLLYKMQWNRVILDEAHHVRNISTDRCKAVLSLKARIRWCLTGTPVQNTVNDFYSLLTFVGFQISPTKAEWNRRWKSKLECARPEVRTKYMKQFQAIIAVVMLRRTKKDKIDKKPILNLPERVTEVIEKELMYPDEKALYMSVQNEAVLAFDKVLKSGSIEESLQVIFVKFLRLRQACFHPYLIEYCSYLRKLDEYKKGDGSEKVTDEEMLYALAMEDTRKGISIRELLRTELGNRRIRFRPKPVANSEDFIDDRPLEEIMEEAAGKLHTSEVGGDEISEGEVTPRPKKRRRIVIEDDDEDNLVNAPVMKPKAERKACKVEDIQVVDLTLDDSEMEATGNETKRLDVVGSSGNKSIKTEVSGDTKTGGVKTEKVVKDEAICLTDGNGIDEKSIVKEEVKQEGTGNSRKRKRGAGSRKELAEKIKEAVMQPSTKMRMLIERLEESKQKDRETKSLVFSQWTSCLDIVQFHVENAGFKCCRLDGKMTIAERGKQIENFSKPQNNVFLISLKAGGEGLNLVMASQVFLVDAWWNPAVEEQAIDRVHRIGQKKDVHIYRFKMLGTFEETVYKIADKKREVIAGTMGGDGVQTIGRQKLKMGEILQLFRSTAKNVLETSGNDAALAAAKSILGK